MLFYVIIIVLYCIYLASACLLNETIRINSLVHLLTCSGLLSLNLDICLHNGPVSARVYSLHSNCRNWYYVRGCGVSDLFPLVITMGVGSSKFRG